MVVIRLDPCKFWIICADYLIFACTIAIAIIIDNVEDDS